MATLFIQIPCFNEEASLPETLKGLPTSLPGVDRIEILVLDDASHDATSHVAHTYGVRRIVRFDERKGLAQSYAHGLRHAVDAGADIIVTLDADNQYHAKDLEALIAPLLQGHADIVIGERSLADAHEFSPIKKFFHRLGAAVFRAISGLHLRDPISGFRAISSSAARQLRVYNTYTYTLETLLQASLQGMRVVAIPVGRNVTVRPSRLIKNNAQYMAKQSFIVFLTYLRYRAFQLFLIPAIGLFVLSGIALGFWFASPIATWSDESFLTFLASISLSITALILGASARTILERDGYDPEQ